MKKIMKFLLQSKLGKFFMNWILKKYKRSKNFKNFINRNNLRMNWNCALSNQSWVRGGKILTLIVEKIIYMSEIFNGRSKMKKNLKLRGRKRKRLKLRGAHSNLIWRKVKWAFKKWLKLLKLGSMIGTRWRGMKSTCKEFRMGRRRKLEIRRNIWKEKLMPRN